MMVITKCWGAFSGILLEVHLHTYEAVSLINNGGSVSCMKTIQFCAAGIAKRILRIMIIKIMSRTCMSLWMLHAKMYLSSLELFCFTLDLKKCTLYYVLLSLSVVLCVS